MHFFRTSNFEEFAADVAWVRQPAAISSFIIVHFPPSPIFAPSFSSFMSTFIFVAPTLLCVFAFIYKLVNAYMCFMCVQICVFLCVYVHKSVWMMILRFLTGRLDLGVWVIFDCLCHGRTAFNAQSTQLRSLSPQFLNIFKAAENCENSRLS